HDRLGRAGVPGKAHRHPVDHRVYLRDHHGVPDPVGELREMVASGGGSAGGPVRIVRRLDGGLSAQFQQRRLFPDRTLGADRTRRQERYPDRRVRRAGAGQGPVASRRRAGGRATARPPDRHDLAGVHARCLAAGARHRRRCGGKALDGHRRLRRHADRDVRRHHFHSAVLRAPDAAWEGQTRAGAGPGRAEDRLMHGRIVLMLALALAGCMVGPDYQRPRTALPMSYADAPEVDAAARPAARADWWTLYGDRMLNQLVATALSDNLDVAAAVARIEEFDADLREANAALFPEIDLGGSAARSRTSAAVAAPQSIRVSTDLRFALTTSFEIDFWGRLRRLLESARAQVLATHYAKDAVTLSLAGLTSQ